MKITELNLDDFKVFEGREPSTLKGYKYRYSLRHDQNNWGKPISIKKSTCVNFFGYIFSKIDLSLPCSGSRTLSEKEIHLLIKLTN